MFSSGNSSNPFQQNNYFNYPSSSPWISHGNTENFYIQHYQRHLPPTQFLLAYAPESSGSPLAMATASNTDSTNQLPEGPVKKDRHSKIYTSHGLRDRRVRLSVGIARQFFDLQDLLGFDKASNTIEWLLTKSKNAIKKLQESKGSCTRSGKSFYPGPKSEEVSESEEDEVEKDGLSACKEEEMNLSPSTVELLAKNSRAKARERAKERTRERIYARKLNGIGRNPEKVFEVGGKSGSMRVTDQTVDPCSASVEESIVITRKIKPASNFDYLQTFQLSKDRISNSYLSCLPQNWDINAPSMGLSTEHQVCEKPWEPYNNQHSGE